jgi:hypothetical protein
MTALTLLELHDSWAWVVVVANGAAGLWALGAHRWAAVRGRALWWFVALAQLSIVLQVGLGVLLVNRSGIPLPQLHAFYGFVGVIAVAIIHSYRNQLAHRLYLLYGFGGLFLMGLGIRAIVLGPS